jgi:hypothetical protein
VVLMPPLSIDTSELRRLVDVVAHSIEAATGLGDHLAEAA